MNEVLVDTRIYDNEQSVIKDLIETNIRQRGDINSSGLKLGRIIKTLEEYYGVRQGSANKKGITIGEVTMSHDITQEDIASQLGSAVKISWVVALRPPKVM